MCACACACGYLRVVSVCSYVASTLLLEMIHMLFEGYKAWEIVDNYRHFPENSVNIFVSLIDVNRRSI